MRIETCRASQQEQVMVLPGDDLLPNAIGTYTHAITIAVLPERVWPWLVQMGGGRAGWYSFDRVDNGGAPSAKSIINDYQQISSGDVFPAIPGATDAFLVVRVERSRHLVLTVPDASGGSKVSWAFLLQPVYQDHTRLIVRARISEHWLGSAEEQPNPRQDTILIERIYGIFQRIPLPIMLAVAGFGHYMMESKMLRGIKRRAEA
jgi:hypothetical protein